MPGSETSIDVLIVDDERHIARFLEVVLAREGYRTSVVHRGDAALAFVRQHFPKVVLLDLGLPGITGEELLSRFNELEERPKVVVLTGRTMLGQFRERLAPHADAICNKPIAPSSLLTIFSRLGVKPCGN